MTYAGLPQGTFTYLAALADNNNRDWFESHRADYDRLWLAAGLDLIAALAPHLTGMQPRLLAVPKLNRSLRRIHRDVRFSADKRPYQPWLHLILSTGPAFNKVPGMHIVLTPQGLGYGAGHYGLDPAALDRMRQRILNRAERECLLAALAQAETVDSRLDPPDLARLPKGYAPAPDWDHLLRRKGLIARTQTDLPAPGWLFTPKAPARLIALVQAHLPLLAWLTA